jgi:hypothetical protein
MLLSVSACRTGKHRSLLAMARISLFLSISAAVARPRPRAPSPLPTGAYGEAAPAIAASFGLLFTRFMHTR